MKTLLKKITINVLLFAACSSALLSVAAQDHPRLYITKDGKPDLLERIEKRENVREHIADIHTNVDKYVERHLTDPEWIVSRLQMYWKTKYKKVYVNGMDFSHGEGTAPVPTVRFSGSRDWDTDYMLPAIEDIIPYMDDERGMYLQNEEKPEKPWEWVLPSETGHIIENINKKILSLAEDAAFLYWLEGDQKYAVFARDIFMKYIAGMYHRDPPSTVEDHKNKDLMGLQTFEVIHESIVRPVTLCYDFLFDFLKSQGNDLTMIQEVFRKWADQEIKYGVPGNNWNLMQARYITYLALALEEDKNYSDGKGTEYYIDQVLNQNSRKQKALKDVIKNFDSETGIWPEVAGYSIMVSDDILEVYCLIDKTLNNNLLGQYPMLEKAILANFNYLFPNGYTTAYGDAKHSRLRFRALELLISQHRKYDKPEKEKLITGQLKRFIEDNAYERNSIESLFQLFFYVEELDTTPPAESFAELVNPTFYSPNVSWVVQRNGKSLENGMMISKNASLGNHSHANGINIELFAKGMVIAPDGAAGESYWSADHKEYYSRFPAHNTVIVDGISDYRTMNSVHAYNLKSIYPSPDNSSSLVGDYTFSNVSFSEPATDAFQSRLT
ncbi:MAG: heparinase II/III-family protein, partial [Cyclobacteriaceae bacterium]|nr:heparinase II/III-family protein [Cyclobacteriaceae bacterium]